MTTINNNTTINVSTMTVGEIFNVSKKLKELARECIFMSVPVGEENAVSSTSILGSEYRYLSNASFKVKGNGFDADGIYREYISFGNVTVHRKMHKYFKQYIAIDNPNEIITIEKVHYLYWRD